MCVLLVEDEPQTRKLIAECLHKAGFEVEEAETGDEALELILDDAERFEALVTDLQMPGRLDGSEVAAAIRKQIPDIPVVIASGRPELFQASWRHELGYGLVSKPFRPSELIDLIQQLMRPGVFRLRKEMTSKVWDQQRLQAAGATPTTSRQERNAASRAVRYSLAENEVTAELEVIVDPAMTGEEALRVTC
jgi:CheY-like chemotaxis protein